MPSPSRLILVTGASGFVGRRLAARLALDGYAVRGVVRRAADQRPGYVRLSGIDAHTDWSDVLDGVDTVIHTAARAHLVKEPARDALQKFREVNVDGTLKLARAAARAGARRFVFISTVKVNGESSGRTPLTERTPPDPVDPYGISKFEAEKGLWEIAAASDRDEPGMDIVVIRPPLVYGPGVKANFLTLMQWLHKGRAVPLGSVRNARSLVFLDNLVDFIVTCITSPAAANETFFVSDGEDLSTTELLRRVAGALGVPARLLPFPDVLLRLGATAVGQRALYQRLCGSLRVDIDKAADRLNWRPPISINEGLRMTARHFLDSGY